MRRVFASVRLQSYSLHQPLVLGLQLHQRLHWSQRCHDRPRLASAERFEFLHAQFERLAPHTGEQRGNLVGDDVIDVTDEAKSHVIVLGIDPARAGKPAAQGGERLRDAGGDFETGKQAGHDTIAWRDLMARWTYRTSRECSNTASEL